MMKGAAAASPDAYVEALDGWRRPLVVMLRDAIKTGSAFDEIIKWHNIVYLSSGPCMLIRAEDKRVLLGFWRGKRLVALDPRIKPSGKYELGNLVITDGMMLDPAHITRLATAAAALNAELGDPTALS